MPPEDAPDPAFDLVVESTGSSTSLLPPPGWESTKHRVGTVTVDAHTRLPSTPVHALGGPILTLHDVGQNAGSCFGPFFAFCRGTSKCPELHAASAHYHITAPGHEPDAATLPQSEPLELATLVRAVEDVLDRFGLNHIVAFGVGLGAAALLRAALHRPKYFAALILVSPVISPAGVGERLTIGADGIFSRQLGLGLTQRAKDRFLHRWLTDTSREENFALVKSLEDGLDRLNPTNLIRLLSADAWRDDITVKLSSLKARLLLITGKESSIRYHTEEAFPMFDPENTSWLDITDCGALAHEEHPDQVAQAVSLLLEGLPPVS